MYRTQRLFYHLSFLVFAIISNSVKTSSDSSWIWRGKEACWNFKAKIWCLSYCCQGCFRSVFFENQWIIVLILSLIPVTWSVGRKGVHGWWSGACPLPPPPSPHAKDCEGVTAQNQASDLSWGVERGLVPLREVGLYYQWHPKALLSGSSNVLF